jgi:acyl carrier protein
MADVNLLALIAGTLGLPPADIGEASDMTNTRKWDSLRQVMLMTELETSYGIELSDQEMTDATSVTKIRAVLQTHGRS